MGVADPDEEKAETLAEVVVGGGRRVVPDEEVEFRRWVSGCVSVVGSAREVVEERALVRGVVREAGVAGGREEGFDSAHAEEAMEVVEGDEVAGEGV